MSISSMRLTLGLLFLVLGTGIFTRGWWLPELDTRFDPVRLNLGAGLALVFGGLNLARWYSIYAYRQSLRAAVRYPLRRDPAAAPEVEPRPEFDFTRPETNDPRPDPNGAGTP